MRIIQDEHRWGPFHEPLGMFLVFTKAEQRLLTRAADLAERARELLPADENDDLDMRLAGIEHGCRDLAHDFPIGRRVFGADDRKQGR